MFMTPESRQTSGDCFIVPGRTLRGSRSEMLAEIEEAVRALMALRLSILAQDTGLRSRLPQTGSPPKAR